MRPYVRVDDMTSVLQIAVVREDDKGQRFSVYRIEKSDVRFCAAVRQRFVTLIDDLPAFDDRNVRVDIPVQFDNDERKTVPRHR